MKDYSHFEHVPDLINSFGTRLSSIDIQYIWSHDHKGIELQDNTCYIYNHNITNNLKSLSVSEFTEHIIPVNLEDLAGGQSNRHSLPVIKSDYVFYFNEISSETYAGTYCKARNILYISMDITHKYNQATIDFFNFVLDTIEGLRPFDESLLDSIKPKDELYITHKNKIFKLLAVAENTSFMQEYAARVTTNAKKAIAQIKEQYLKQLEIEKSKLLKYKKTHLAMPEILFNDVIKHKVMISKYDNRLHYNFIISFKVTEAVDEYARKRLVLDKPIIFNDRILHMQIDDNNKLSGVYMFDINGRPEEGHMHISSGSICTGTTGIIGQKVENLADAVKLKDKLIEALTRYNVVDAMQRGSFRDELALALKNAPADSWTSHIWHISS